MSRSGMNGCPDTEVVGAISSHHLSTQLPVLQANWFSRQLVFLRVHALCSLHICGGCLSRSPDSSHIHKHITGVLQSTFHIHCGDLDCISERYIPTKYKETHSRKYIYRKIARTWIRSLLNKTTNTSRCVAYPIEPPII